MASVRGVELKKLLFGVVFRGDTPPATVYLRLGRGALPAATATLAQINEVDGSGYAALALARGTTDWAVPSVSGSTVTLSSVLKNMASTGSWNQADFAYLATTADDTGAFLVAASFDEVFRLLTDEDIDIGISLED